MVNEQFKKKKKENSGQTESETKNQVVSYQVAVKNTQSNTSRFSYVHLTLEMFGSKTNNVSKLERSAEVQYTSK